MVSIRLTETSYVVLGLLATWGAATSYDLKRMVAETVGNFWSFPHSQLYAEPARLAEAGLLEEEQEEGGRRRRIYRLTDQGRTALRGWLAEPTHDRVELRDPGLLKLFFSMQGQQDDLERLVADRLAVHRGRLEAYEALQASLPAEAVEEAPLPLATLRRGIYSEQAAVRFWEELAGEHDIPFE